MRLAKVFSGVVVNIISSDAANYAAHFSSYVDLTGQPQVQIGWLYDGTTFSAPATVDVKRVYTLSEWIDALTDAELDVILDYVHGASGTANQQRAARRVWEWWRANDLVDFNLPKTVAVVTWLVNNSGGVWTAQRRDELIG